jgi:hypothetical protein
VLVLVLGVMTDPAFGTICEMGRTAGARRYRIRSEGVFASYFGESCC